MKSKKNREEDPKGDEEKGKRGRCLPRSAPRRHLAGVREDGQVVRALAKGIAASLLDGGALTRVGSARRRRGHQWRHVARSPLLLVTLRAAALRREKGKNEKCLGFQGQPRPGRGFDPATSSLGRRINVDASD